MPPSDDFIFYFCLVWGLRCIRLAVGVQSLESGLAVSVDERDRQLAMFCRLRRRYHQMTTTAAMSTSQRRTGSRCSTSSTESSGLGDSTSSDESGQYRTV